MCNAILAGAILSVSAAFSQSLPGIPEASLISKSIPAVSYQVRGGSTKINFTSTSLVPQAGGEATVEAKQGVTVVSVTLNGLAGPSRLGAEFLTYVLWVVSPEGRYSNVGEVQPDESGRGKLKATTPLQTFSIFVTAEPYFAVRQPSEMVILENQLRKDTKGKIMVVGDYQLMKRAQYQKMGNPLALVPDLSNVPLELYEARNAVEIARSRRADQYAPEVFRKAQGGLDLAEQAFARKANRKQLISTARLAVQSSEDARAIAVQKQEEERIANERAAAAAKAKAEAEAKAAREAEQARREADARTAALRRQADEEARRQAQLASARQAQIKAEAEAAAWRAKVEADGLKAKEAAANAEAARAREAAEALRTQLLDQLNRVLETRDTPRGLVVTMADVLFDVGKHDLRPVTREKLARLSGIVLAHPGLQLEIEGHTDSTGSDEFNQKLSDRRAMTVQSYLIEQGVSPEYVTAKGFGKALPVADNTTAAGRQQNRRVEIVVSGEVIGVKISK